MEGRHQQAPPPSNSTDTANNPRLLEEIRAQVIDLIERVTGSRQVVIAHTLIVDFFGGDHNAAILLNQILYWTSRSQDSEQWFYKTYDDWYQELRFSPYQVWRVVRGDDRVQKYKRTLWSIGLETEVRMAPNGRNATFYRLNTPAFMTAFTEWLEATYQVNLGPVPQANAPQPKPNPLRKFEKHFGRLTTKTKKTLFGMQQALGENRTHTLIERAINQCRNWHDVIAELQKAVIELARGQEPVPPLAALPWQTDTDAPVRDFIGNDDPPVTASERILKNPTRQEHWNSIRVSLQNHMTAASFHNLLREAILVDWQQNGDMQTLVIAVPTTFIVEELAGRQYRLIRQIAGRYVDGPVDVQFITYATWRDQPRE